MPSDIPTYSLRLKPELRAKLQYIADDNFRPVSKEIERLVLRYIAEYETEHGEIKIPEE
jgi:predicted DNA-binding protein